MPIDFNEIAKQIEEKVKNKIAQLSEEEKEELLKKHKEIAIENRDKIDI